MNLLTHSVITLSLHLTSKWSILVFDTSLIKRIFHFPRYRCLLWLRHGRSLENVEKIGKLLFITLVVIEHTYIYTYLIDKHTKTFKIQILYRVIHEKKNKNINSEFGLVHVQYALSHTIYIITYMEQSIFLTKGLYIYIYRHRNNRRSNMK